MGTIGAPQHPLDLLPSEPRGLLTPSSCWASEVSTHRGCWAMSSLCSPPPAMLPTLGCSSPDSNCGTKPLSSFIPPWSPFGPQAPRCFTPGNVSSPASAPAVVDPSPDAEGCSASYGGSRQRLPEVPPETHLVAGTGDDLLLVFYSLYCSRGTQQLCSLLIHPDQGERA